MSERKTGEGYGTIENLRISILILAPPDRREEALAMDRALKTRHSISVFSPKNTAIFKKLAAARAASEIQPHIIHALGVEGVARAANSISAAMDIPLVVSLNTNDIQNGNARAIQRVAKQANAVVVETEDEANLLRESSVDRDLYVNAAANPDDESSDRFFLGAIEVVYGRVVHVDRLPEPSQDDDGTPLVSIGGCSQGGKG